MPTLLVVDGHSMAFRAFYAMPDSVRDPQGQPVHAIYGFLSMLFRQVAALQPEGVAVVFDEGRPFREALFADYKAGRQEIDPEVQRQVTRLRGLLALMRLPQFAVPGFEADDVIATLVRQARAHPELHTIVLSGDRDLFGLIGPQSSVLYPTRSMAEAERYDEARLWQRWAIRPEQVAEFKALVGDPSDNIPGVRGIGEKTAAALLARFDSLDALYANLDSVTPTRARNALSAGEADARLSLRLAQLVDEVPGVALDRAACRIAYDRAEVEAAFDELGFASLRERLP